MCYVARVDDVVICITDSTLKELYIQGLEAIKAHCKLNLDKFKDFQDSKITFTGVNQINKVHKRYQHRKR